MNRNRVGLLLLAAALAMGVLAIPMDPPPAKAQDVDRIEAAVKKGAAFLRSASWLYMDAPAAQSGEKFEYDVGVAALCGMAMLESKMPVGDPAVSKAYSLVKRSAPTMGRTYPVALAAMFLSRYGNAGDAQLIKSLCIRLAAAQKGNGAWSYDAPVISPQAEAEWVKWLNARAKLTKLDPADEHGQSGSGGVSPDNSNTQFAVLALWMGRKSQQGASVSYAYPLLRCEHRFRSTQHPGGAWTYGMTATDFPAAGMTCAGLLALAVGHGNSQEQKTAVLRSGGASDGKGSSGGGTSQPQGITLDDLQTDNQVLRAKKFIEEAIREGKLEHFEYFLWSLERVCVVYGWDKDNWWDWYGWGSEILLKAQQGDGSWSYEYGKSVDTAFALLFLNRANLLKDLTKKATLRSGDNKSVSSGGAGAKPPTAGNAPPATKDDLSDDPKVLGKELITSTGSKREAIITKLKMGKGTDFTTCLADAIPQLTGADQKAAREALAERMGRLTPSSLKAYLEVKDKEQQLAAAKAAAGKKERGKELTPALAALLDDFDENLKNAAYEALKAVTGTDLGRSASAWQAWWSKQSGSN